MPRAGAAEDPRPPAGIVPEGTTELGIDIIKVERIAAALERFGDRFSRRVLTDHERKYVRGRAETFAGRWAAKEAVSKVLGLGVRGIGWRDIEVQRRQVVERGQAEPLEELEAGAVQDRAAGRVRAALLGDQPSVQERPHRVVRVHAADPLDGGPGHRLAIGDDGKGLERRRREAHGVDADVPGHEGAGVWSRRELSAVAGEHQADPASRQ